MLGGISIFEHMTYEKIMTQMTDRALLHDKNIDTREGSIIFNALAPAAVELQNMYVNLDMILNETFADTASREMLIKRVAERGITPEPATKAVLKGEFNIDIDIGTRFSLEQLNYVVKSQMAQGVYQMECETFGVVGNQNFGTLIPINYVPRLEKAELTELLIPGEEVEETEHLRQRYFRSLDAEAFGGNIADYQEKVNAIPGVGGVKIYPIWNGGGTVRLVVIDSEYHVPTPELIDAVQTAIDPTQNRGKGMGIAPIGHIVTVEGAQSFEVSIATNITYLDGWGWLDLEPYAQKIIDDYFAELRKEWDRSEALIIRISQIETRLLTIPNVVDIQNTAINGDERNLILGVDCIPKRGDLSG